MLISYNLHIVSLYTIHLERITTEMKYTYTTQYTVRQVCQILGVELPAIYENIADDVLTNMAYNTHFLTEGGAYFLAGKTSEDRAEKLAKAIEEKAKLVFIGPASRDLDGLDQIPHILVPNPFDAVITLSATIRDKLGLNVIGITGSLGKTTTKDIIHAVLKQGHVASKSLGNQNTIYPIFNNLQKMPLDTEFYVQEFGAATPGVMPKTERACLPNAGVITNISDPHLDVFGTRENILKEKLQLITQMPEGCPAFLNYDDELLRQVKLDKHPIISYAINNKKADYYARDLKVYDDYMTFDIVHKWRRTPVRLNAHGTHNVGNALVAAAIGEWFGMSQKDIAKGIASYKSVGIRQNLTNVGGYQLFIDCYNTAPVSLLGTVDVVGKLPVTPGGKRIAVIGDIARLGDQAQELHIDTGTKIGASGSIDLALCFGNENAKLMADAIRQAGTAALYTGDRDELNYWMKSLITRKDITLIKGPVARLLSRSIDQVWGTSYHVTSEHFEWVTREDFRFKVIYEKEDHSRKMAALTGYEGSEHILTIPSQCDGVDVFCVGPQCFYKNFSLNEVTVPAPIFNIAAGAFRGCRKMTALSLPDTLKVIEKKAFRYCVSLTDVTVPEGVIEIGDEAFAHCDKLEKLLIPATVGNIGQDAFLNCGRLTIHCPAGSCAHTYAQTHKIPFVLI